MNAEKNPPVSNLALSWSDEEIENRFGFFRAGRFTSVNKTLSFVIALVFTAVFFALVTFLLNSVPASRPYAIVFVRPGNLYTTGPAMLFFFWATMMLFFKSRKIDF